MTNEVFRLIEKNTPVRIEIANERWGRGGVRKPEILFEIWKVLQEAKSYPNRYIPNQDRIEGHIYFRDGKQGVFLNLRSFSVRRILTGCKEDDLRIAKLHRIFRYI